MIYEKKNYKERFTDGIKQEKRRQNDYQII